MPCDFGKGKKFFLRHQRFVLRCDDPIELAERDNAVQIGGGIQILSQKPRGGILQRDLPIERI